MDSLNDMTLAQLDPEIQAVLDSELGRQRETLEMIASENFVPRAVLEAQGSVLTNKYAEGYPGRRYYGGCEFVDVAESLAIERAKQVFGVTTSTFSPMRALRLTPPPSWRWRTSVTRSSACPWPTAVT